MGLEPGASNSEIKRKYRELAKIWHPDKNPGCKECAERFEKLSEAYNTLMDDIKRSDYDSVIFAYINHIENWYYQNLSFTNRNYHYRKF